MARSNEYDEKRFLRAKMAISILAVVAAATLAIIGITAGYGLAESLLIGAMSASVDPRL